VACVTGRAEEQVALIDESGLVIGVVPRSQMRRENLPHLVVAILVRDPAGRVYVHRRTDTKDVFPGAHDCWVAGCVAAGEEPLDAAVRELAEELGIVGVPLQPLFQQWYADTSTRHVAHCWTVTWDGPVVHQPEEVAWGAWMTPTELAARLADPTWPFVPDGRALYERWAQSFNAVAGYDLTG
jgi:8-oxo-dGTP pyrophosphatase MutT (NUDIX family)